MLKELAEIDAKHPEREERLRRVVRFFKNNPGLGVWKGADEPQWGKIPVPALVRAYKIIHEEDPNHPVWIVHAPRGTVEELRALRCDVRHRRRGCLSGELSARPSLGRDG